MKNWCLARSSLGFLLTQQHVGDPAADGEHTSRLWALQGTLHHIHLREEGKQRCTGRLRGWLHGKGSKL